MRFFAENNRPGFEYAPARNFSLVGHWLQSLRSRHLLKTRQRLIAIEFAIPFVLGRRTDCRATTARNALSKGVANHESEP